MKLSSLLGSTCVASLALAAVPAAADTTVTGDSNTPLVTSSAGDITIRTDATLEVGAGAAITVNSNNDVTIEDDDEDDSEDVEGQVVAGEGDGATGILVKPGALTTVTNGGTISVLEDFEPEDEDGDGIVDGALTAAGNRYGIYVEGGGTVTGTIENNGTITVEGANSGGIVVDSALDGTLIQNGTIRVVGDNSVGVRTGDVSGDLVMEGSTLVTGRGATALSVEGDIGGTIRIQGIVGQSTSFAYDDDGSSVSLSRFDLRLGAPAVSIAGDVAGGIIVAAQPVNEDDNDDDEDNDGVDDSEEGTGNVYSYGNGPAMRIAGDDDITIGQLAGSGYSLLIEGTVSGTANYSNTDAYGIVIGGGDGAVHLPGGIGVTGTVSATTYDESATALLLAEGVTAPYLTNSGTISATISSPGEGAAYAIRDLSGSLTTVENTGFITASGSSTDVRQAINLANATDDVTITQYMNEEDLATRAEIEEDLEEGETDPTVYTRITGDIVTGSGNDTLSANAGQIIGNIYFNNGNDRLLLSGEAEYYGKVYFGTGSALAELSDEAYFSGNMDFGSLSGTLSITDNAIFSGTISGGTAASVIVDGGTFGLDGAKTISIGSLTVKSGGTLNAYLDTGTQTASLIIADTAVFESGAKVSATVDSLSAEGTYVILQAANLEGDPVFDETTTELPYIFVGSIDVDGNDLVLDIRRKTAVEVGLTGAATSGYDAILTAARSDDTIAQSFLDIMDRDTLQGQVSQMLPDHAGGLFDQVTSASRLAARHVMDGDANFDITETGDMSIWLEPVFWRGNRNATATNSYKTNGWGMSGGAEWLTGIGYVGGSYAWLSGSVENNGGTGTVDTSQHDLAAFWRTAGAGPFYAFARLGAARTSFSSTRDVTVTANEVESTYSTTGDWDGWLFSAMGGASWTFEATSRFTIRPKAVLEWYRLSEDGYTESGGGEAIDLTVAKRNSSALNAIGSVALSYAFGTRNEDYRPLTFELEAGRRTNLSGKLGATTANFTDEDDVAGDPFSIRADPVDDAWLGEARLLAGGWDYLWKIAAGAEKATNSDIAYSARVSLSVAF
jgi:hypothetical protein